ncbi:MAG TPA: hypothetical protein VF170_00690 [Planctomycetaceae bacterium]
MTAEIDRALAARADLLGVPAENEPHVRVWTLHREHPRIVVTFRVDPDDRRVRVARIRFGAEGSHEPTI